MVDVFGYPLKVGSLVLATSSTISISPSSLGLLVGENEVFRISDKGKGRIVKCKDILCVIVDTEEKKRIYNVLLESYQNQMKEHYKIMSKYRSEISIGDVLKMAKTKSGRYVYLGYCSFKEIRSDVFKNDIIHRNEEGYLYVSYRFVSDLKDELNSKCKNITYKEILKRLFVSLSSDYYVFSKIPLEYVEKLDSIAIQGHIDNYTFEYGYKYIIDYNSFKDINVVEVDEDE